MRTTHLGTKVQEEFTGLVDAASVGGGVLGGGVLAYRPYSIPSAASSDMTPDHDVRLLDHDGRYSPACHNTATWQTAGVFGGAVLGDYHPVEVLPGFRFDLAVTAVWGHRYPNVSVVAVVPHQPAHCAPPGGRIVMLTSRWAAADVSEDERLPRQRVYPWVMYPVWLGRGPRGGLRWNHYGPGNGFTTDLREARVVSDFFSDTALRSHAPGNLLAVRRDQTGFYKLSRGGNDRPCEAQFYDVTREPPDTYRWTQEIAPPADLRHPAPTDFQVAADGSRLFVAWSGKGIDNVRRATHLGVYDAETCAPVVCYKFPAALIAPSVDGLTLSFLDGFGGGGPLTLRTIDLD